jgi:hypothetical protein
MKPISWKRVGIAVVIVAVVGFVAGRSWVKWIGPASHEKILLPRPTPMPNPISIAGTVLDPDGKNGIAACVYLLYYPGGKAALYWEGEMPTPRTGETLSGGSGAEVLDDGLRIIAPETGEDVTDFYIKGSAYTLEIAEIIGAKKAYMKGGSPACDKEGVTGETLRRAGVEVIRVS